MIRVWHTAGQRTRTDATTAWWSGAGLVGGGLVDGVRVRACARVRVVSLTLSLSQSQSQSQSLSLSLSLSLVTTRPSPRCVYACVRERARAL